MKMMMKNMSLQYKLKHEAGTAGGYMYRLMPCQKDTDLVTRAIALEKEVSAKGLHVSDGILFGTSGRRIGTLQRIAANRFSFNIRGRKREVEW